MFSKAIQRTVTSSKSTLRRTWVMTSRSMSSTQQSVAMESVMPSRNQLPRFFSTTTLTQSTTEQSQQEKAREKGEEKEKEEEKEEEEKNKERSESEGRDFEKEYFSPFVRGLADFAIAALVGGTLTSAWMFLKDFPMPCRQILTVAAAHPLFKENIGEPYDHGLFWSGFVSEDTASVIIPVSGPKGSGHVHGKAFLLPSPVGPAWQVVVCHATFKDVAGGQLFDLLEGENLIGDAEIARQMQALQKHGFHPPLGGRGMEGKMGRALTDKEDKEKAKEGGSVGNARNEGSVPSIPVGHDAKRNDQGNVNPHNFATYHGAAKPTAER